MLGIGSQETENIVHRPGDFRISRHQTQVGIKPRSSRIVVARAEMRITARNSVRISADQQRQLAMCLQPDQAMENLYAGIFQIARPADVRGLVKARLQLHYRRHFFLGSGLDQCSARSSNFRWCDRASA